jgi:small redox-active disulfide protein 2
MKIQILGPGCTRCKQLHEAVINAAVEMDLAADIEKVDDIQEIVKAGVMSTPALVIDGQVKSVGRVLSVTDIKKLLSEQA